MPVIAPAVDPGFASWLKAAALYIDASDTDVAAKWGAMAKETTIQSALTFPADASIEAARQMRFLGGPLVRDEHIVSGLRHDLVGKRIRIRTNVAQHMGYDGPGRVAIVIKAVESPASDTTVLSVIRRLA